MSPLATVWTIAGLTLKRVLRGRALWVSILIATLPIGFAYMLRERDRSELATAIDVFAFEQLVLAVLPALFVASSIGEDIEDRTTTYLWSRPVPRWSVLAGKLVALVPMIWLLSLASWFTALLVGLGELPEPASCLALMLDTTALSLVAAAIATLVPRHAMALTICYMLFFDLSLGLMPAAIKYVSVTHHARVIAELNPDHSEDLVSSAVIGIGVLAVLWTSVGLSRIRRLEA